MDYIVLDLEWNQSAKGKDFQVEGMPFEIIQLGAVKLDKEMNMAGQYSAFIKPKVYLKLHDKVREMLGITQQDIDKGVDFEVAAKEFLEWCGDDYMFVTWGSADLTELQRNMNYYGIKNTFPQPFLFYDLQKLYSIQFLNGKDRVSLKCAIDELGVEDGGGYHSAINDALYTARIMQKMDFESVSLYKSIDTYIIPKSRKKEIYMNFGNYQKYISKGFKSGDTAMSDRVVRSCECFLCKKPMKRLIRWFSTNSKVHYGLFLCEKHGLIRGKFKAKQDDNGMYYVIKILKCTDEEGAQKIRSRQLKEQERRRKKRNMIRDA